MESLNKPWEIGSEFHWPGVPQGPFHPWPEPHIMFSSGRDALLTVWRTIQKDTNSVLHVPDYFCAEVVSWWENHGVIIRRYSDGPHKDAPDWETLTVSTGDAVLAVNFFGVREGNVWDEWRRVNKNIFLLEDHSHDPLSDWALNSKADYAFASLRKTFPTPDGATLWSPRSLPLPDEPSFGDFCGSALKLAAMILKRDYLEGSNGRIKEIFRGFQLDGERNLAASNSMAVSPWSRFLLASGCPLEWRKRRAENARIFLNLISLHPSIRSLFTVWPEKHCPFNAVLQFPSKNARDECRSSLIKSQVYPMIHWELSPESSVDSLQLASRIMTIPVDQRYNVEDMKRVASLLFDM